VYPVLSGHPVHTLSKATLVSKERTAVSTVSRSAAHVRSLARPQGPGTGARVAREHLDVCEGDEDHRASLPIVKDSIRKLWPTAVRIVSMAAIGGYIMPIFQYPGWLGCSGVLVTGPELYMSLLSAPSGPAGRPRRHRTVPQRPPGPLLRGGLGSWCPQGGSRTAPPHPCC
jgi:hypothetical protein